MTCGIYILKSPSFKYYIGQSVDIEARLNEHSLRTKDKRTKFGNALKKYGFERFQVRIKRCPKISLDEMERYYVKLYDSFRNGYNGTEGGGGGDTFAGLSEERLKEIKDKQSKATIDFWTGRIHTPETILKSKVTHSNRPKVDCPWCHRTLTVNAAKQFHFDYCKLNPNHLTHAKVKQTTLSKTECPHCGVVMDNRNYAKHHGDKCKDKPL